MNKIEMVAQTVQMSYVEILHEESAIHPTGNKILVSCAYWICPEHNHSLKISMQNKVLCFHSSEINPAQRKEN